MRVLLLLLALTQAKDSGLTQCELDFTSTNCFPLTGTVHTTDLINKGYYCTDNIGEKCDQQCTGSSTSCRKAHFYCGQSDHNCQVVCRGSYACENLVLNCQKNHDCQLDLGNDDFSFRGEEKNAYNYVTAVMHCPDSENVCEVTAGTGEYQLERALIEGNGKSEIKINIKGNNGNSGQSFARSALVKCAYDGSCTINLGMGTYAGQNLRVRQEGKQQSNDRKSTARADLIVQATVQAASGGFSLENSEIVCPSNAACRIHLARHTYGGRYLKVDGNQNARLEVIAPTQSQQALEMLRNAEITCPKSGKCSVVCSGGTYACEHLKILQMTGTVTAPLYVRLSSNSGSGGDHMLRNAQILCPNAASWWVFTFTLNIEGCEIFA